MFHLRISLSRRGRVFAPNEGFFAPIRIWRWWQRLRVQLPMMDHSGEADRVWAALTNIEGRSPLQDWLRRNRTLVEARFALSRPRWASVAAMLAELGVVDAHGRPPTAQATRQAWYRVRAERPAAVPRDLAPHPAARANPQPVPSKPVFDPTEGAFDARPTPRFRPASLK